VLKKNAPNIPVHVTALQHETAIVGLWENNSSGRITTHTSKTVHVAIHFE